MITFHGLALNVNTDLSYFNRIIPCGLSWADVTSMARELGGEQNHSEVCEPVSPSFRRTVSATQRLKRPKMENGRSKIAILHHRSSILK